MASIRSWKHMGSSPAGIVGGRHDLHEPEYCGNCTIMYHYIISPHVECTRHERSSRTSSWWFSKPWESSDASYASCYSLTFDCCKSHGNFHCASRSFRLLFEQLVSNETQLCPLLSRQLTSSRASPSLAIDANSASTNCSWLPHQPHLFQVRKRNPNNPYNFT